MNFANRKTMAFAVAAFLIIAISIPLISVPSAKAATYKSYPFLGAVPNPVGVGQEVLLHVGTLTALNTASDGWEGLTVTVTKPDGTTETLSAPRTDSTGGTGLVYVPNQVGNYTMVTNFPEQDYRGNTYLAAQSDSLTLVVQQEPIEYYPAHPLPTEYWTRPIDSQIREWYTIAGSWVAKPTNLYAPYNNGPETPHILWTRPVGESMGGLAGGDLGQHSFGIGDAYEGKFAGSIIVGGVLYYHQSESGSPTQPVVAVDLHTGEVLWKKVLLDNERVDFGQVLYWDSLNYHGAFSYIVAQIGGGFFGGGSITWVFFDALTGDWRFNMTNVPGGTNYYGPNGEILKYSITRGHLLKWNSSYVVNRDKTGMSESWGSQVKGRVYDASERPGYDLNVSIPALAQGGSLPGSVLTAFPGDRLIGGSLSQSQGVRLWGLSLKPGQEGQLLFNNTWASPREWIEGNITVSGFQAGWAAYSEEDKVAVLFAKELRKFYAFSLETGQYMWQTAESQPYLDAWDDSLTVFFGPNNVIAYGKLYSASISGRMHSYDVQTGELLWTYDATDPYSEFQFSNNWWLRIVFVTDGKIYAGHIEHSPIDPRPRGAPFICLDAETGEEIFRADGLFRQTRWGGLAIIGDSIIATMDTYNQQVYGIGKGPSVTTVTAPDVGVTLGSSVTIRGSVMDVSPGTEDYALRARFPNGVAAVSDESMSDWMLYAYKQFPRPMDTVGVEVSIDVLDANGNYRNIGTAVTDSSGFYSLQWTPDVPGKYTVIAAFMGSKGYYGSFDETAFSVDEKPDPPPTPEPVQLPPTEMYITYATIATIASIVIVGIAILLVLRRK